MSEMRAWKTFLAIPLFALGAWILWMIPVLLTGVPEQYPLLLPARGFADAGIFAFQDGLGRFLSPELLSQADIMNDAQDGRLSTMLYGLLSGWIPWSAGATWTGVAAAIMAAAVGMWIVCCSQLIGKREAWISAVFLVLSPVMWQQTLRLDNFHLALLFLFACGSAFLCLRTKSYKTAFVVSGLLFGLSAASKDVFLIFVPWIVIGFIWERGLQQGAKEILMFGLPAVAVYLLPYIGDILEYGYPINWNLAHFWPGGGEIANETYLHLYPDAYTYLFDREWFDTAIVERTAGLSWLERVQQMKTFIGYDIVPVSFWMLQLHGLWLLLNSIPSFFQGATVGGPLMWLLILPGGYRLYQDHRRLFWHSVGLILSSYIVIRVVLHYNREHLMDIAWILSLFAALGVGVISERVRIVSKHAGVIIILIFSLHLLLVNRTVLAQSYRKTMVPSVTQAAEAISTLPRESITAVPLHPNLMHQLALQSGRSVVLFSEETVARLLEKNIFSEVFVDYGVTHVIRYSEDLSSKMVRTMPSLGLMQDDNPPIGIREVSPVMKYVLNIIK